jgi:hypothetical protein
MTETLETHGQYRVRLEIMQDGAMFNPRTNQDCNLTNVITPTQSGGYIKIDEDGGPLQHGWDHFSVRPDSEDLFIRWAKIFHGATVVVDRPYAHTWGLWYLMPDKAKESTWSPERVIEAEIKEYQQWADGEIYGFVIERSVRWVPEEGQVFKDGEPTPNPMVTWETVSSCGGYFGYEYAKEAALEEFEPYKEDN